jgi:predicted phosphodiesterase
MRLALLADIHGNLPALLAVLADMERHAITAIADLGDCVSGPLWPAETLARLRGLGAMTVRGNHDRIVGTGLPGSMGLSDAFAHQMLDAQGRAWLADLPRQREVGPGVLAFHAQPGTDEAYLIEDIVAGRLTRAPQARIAARLGVTKARIIVCGHSHRADLVRLDDGRLVINPGSVGCPAYDDDEGADHVSEAGTPHARYAILDLTGAAADVTFRAVAYDWETAARRAETNGRADWAHGLRTGMMPAELRARRNGTWQDPVL